jgi:hypothetical protein
MFLILILFIFSQLWKTVLGGGQIAGLNATGMLWYMVFTEVITLSTPATHRTVSNDVKSGDLAYKLSRPYSYILYYLAVHCGEFLVRLLTNLLVGAAFAYLTMGSLAVEWDKLGWMILGLALAVAINFLMNFSLALLAFWLEVRFESFHLPPAMSAFGCLAGHMHYCCSVADHRKPLIFGLTAVKTAVKNMCHPQPSPNPLQSLHAAPSLICTLLNPPLGLAHLPRLSSAR